MAVTEAHAGAKELIKPVHSLSWMVACDGLWLLLSPQALSPSWPYDK